MGPLGVVGPHSGLDGGSEFCDGLPVARPDELDLEGLDDPFCHSVAGGAPDGTERVLEPPRRRELHRGDAHPPADRRRRHP